MPEPLLPELTPQSTVTAFSTAGKWDSRTGQNVDDLRKSLKVTPARIQVNSIPDVWARPLLFEMALFDPTHALHARILGEWRGLLALLALKSVKGISTFSAKPVHIGINPNPARNTKFLDVAAKMRPSHAITPATSFENSYIFVSHDKFRDRAIGMTSPMTLVFTSTYYFDHLSGIQWFNGEHLESPVDHLSAIELPALASWLHNLRTQLQGIISEPHTDTTILNKLTGLIEDFTQDLRVPPTEFVPASHGFNISPAHGVFYFLDKPAAQPPAPVSPVRLLKSPGRAGTPEILIVDSELPLQWGLEPKQISIGTKTLMDALPAGHPKGEHTTFAGTRLTDFEAWNATEFFTDKLTLFRVPNVFPGIKAERWIEGDRPSDISLILPIGDKLLQYLTPGDLISRMAFSRGAGGEITVTLRLSLGDDTTTRDFTVSKKYSSADFEYLDEVPIIEVFPNFKVPDWKTYFLVYAANNAKFAFQIRPFVTDAGAPFRIPSDSQNALTEITQLDEYPEALICSVDGKPAGLLLLPEPQHPPAQPTTHIVGVDFGASGTSVYHGSDVTKVVPLTLRNHKLSVSNLSDNQRAKVIDFFLPAETIEVPFLSLFKQFVNESDLQDIRPIVEGHIHYYTADSKLDLSRPNIYADLKWSGEPQSRLRVRALLTQLCFQTAVELASQGITSINWRFSFPTAFSEPQRDQFATIWGQIVAKCSELTGLSFSEPTHQTESIAAAQYFREKQNATTATSAVFVDIGSSTSDISVWQHDKLLWQISVRFAGRDIFHRYLMSHPEILKRFGLDTEKLERTRAAGIDAKLWAETDALLQEHSAQMFKQLPLLGPTPEIVLLRQHLALGLSGLVYYIGLGINHLIAENLFTERMPSIYIGGNGSRMFRWLSDGNVKLASPSQSLFATVFQSALEKPLEGTFNVELSDAPKQEAAYGLVCRNNLASVNDHSTAVVAGEKFMRDGVEHDWNTVIDSEFFKAVVHPPRQLDRIVDFVATFNNFAELNPEFANPIIWDDRAVDEIRARIATDLNDIKNQGIMDVEPVFIIALRNLLQKNSAS